MQVNVVIRPFLSSDFDAFCDLLSDEEVMEYIEPPFSRERAAVFFQDTCHCTPPLIYAVDFEGVFAGYVIFHD